MKTYRELVTEASKKNPKVPFKGEYEIQFETDGVNRSKKRTVNREEWYEGRSASKKTPDSHTGFYVDHRSGDEKGNIYVKFDWDYPGINYVNEKKFVAYIKKQVSASEKAGETIKVEVHKK
jgi:hypothetical protein